MKSIWTKENVEDAVRHTSNIRQCLIYLGVDPRSSSRNTLKKKIQEYNIDTSHFVLKNYNRTYNGKTQVCNCCGKEKPITEFYINSRNKTGIQPTCKEYKGKTVQAPIEVIVTSAIFLNARELMGTIEALKSTLHVKMVEELKEKADKGEATAEDAMAALMLAAIMKKESKED